MDSNYEWQRQHAQQRIQKLLGEAEQQRLSKQDRTPPRGWFVQNIVLLPYRLVAAFAHRIRSQETRPATIKPRTG